MRSRNRLARGLAGAVVVFGDAEALVVALQAEPRIRRVQQRQAGDIAGLEGAAVQFRRDGGFRAHGALCQRVPSHPEIGRGKRVQAEISLPLFERPLGVVRNMVPLPHHLKLWTREIVATRVGGSDRLNVTRVRLHPG